MRGCGGCAEAETTGERARHSLDGHCVRRPDGRAPRELREVEDSDKGHALHVARVGPCADEEEDVGEEALAREEAL